MSKVVLDAQSSDFSTLRCSERCYTPSPAPGLLGGGVRAGEGMLELVGAPGAGKTQVCMQLALNVQIPEALGGLQGTCAYALHCGELWRENAAC